MAALTVRMIEAIRPRDKPFKVTIDRGLQLRVAPDGRRTLLVRYTVKGYPDECQYSLPREYGDGAGQIKLADAKAEAARIRALARDGIDWPEQQARELQKAGEQKHLAAKKQELTFAEALQEYAERKRRSKDGLPLKARTKADYLGMVTPGRLGRDGQRFADGELVALANLRLSDITPDAIRRTYERCARRSARRASYAMEVLRAVLRWHGVVIADNPLGKDTAGRDRIVLAPPMATRLRFHQSGWAPGGMQRAKQAHGLPATTTASSCSRVAAGSRSTATRSSATRRCAWRMSI
jgi:Arm DNA-binding domain